jgi:hypothetical protein
MDSRKQTEGTVNVFVRTFLRFCEIQRSFDFLMFGRRCRGWQWDTVPLQWSFSIQVFCRYVDHCKQCDLETFHHSHKAHENKTDDNRYSFWHSSPHNCLAFGRGQKASRRRRSPTRPKKPILATKKRTVLQLLHWRVLLNALTVVVVSLSQSFSCTIVRTQSSSTSFFQCGVI